MYTIKEVSKKVKISTYTLRYYERAGIFPKIARNSNGNREFSEADIQWINMVHCLRSTGMPIAQIKHYVDLSKNKNSLAQRRQIMLDHKNATEQKISDLADCLQLINDKIDFYDLACKQH